MFWAKTDNRSSEWRRSLEFGAPIGKAIAAGASLIALVYAILAAAEFGMIPTTNGYCELKFPKWLGCVIANHENLAGGLIGAAGTLFAGWLAWTAVQTQMEDARQRAVADRSEVETLLDLDVDDIADALGAMWKVLEAIHDEQPDEVNQTRLDAVKVGVNFVTEPIWIETTRSMIEVLGWRRRRLYANLLNSLIEIKRLENVLAADAWQLEIAVTHAAGACEILFPETSEYFKDRFRRSPKAYTWGHAVLMYADLPEDAT